MSVADPRRAVWDPDKSILVRKPFTWSGADLKIGDTFNWRALGCDLRRLEQLWKQRYVDCGALPSDILPKSAQAPLNPPTRPAQQPQKHDQQHRR